MDKYLAHYVVSHYFSLLTPNERFAYRHLIATLKATHGRSDVQAQMEASQHKVHSKLISDDPEVRSLASEGMEAFEQLTATRILQEHRSEIFLNYCPECGGLARTPKSRQCLVCLYDWHDA